MEVVKIEQLFMLREGLHSRTMKSQRTSRSYASILCPLRFLIDLHYSLHLLEFLVHHS